MAINEIRISKDIVKLIKGNKGGDSDEAIKFFADGMAKIIKNSITSGEVVVSAGIQLSVDPITHSGATISEGSGYIE